MVEGQIVSAALAPLVGSVLVRDKMPLTLWKRVADVNFCDREANGTSDCCRVENIGPQPSDRHGLDSNIPRSCLGRVRGSFI